MTMRPSFGLLLLVTAMGLGHAPLVHAQPPGFERQSGSCRTQVPRFPERVASYRALNRTSPDRIQIVRVAPKDAARSLFVEAQIEELDLTGDGICDLIVMVRDPIDVGGDSDVLSTLYLAQNGRWSRLGARSAARSDLPSDLAVGMLPGDDIFQFSDYVVMRRAGDPRTFLVTWCFDRVQGRFFGYRILQLDAAGPSLRTVDKWSGEGATIYAAFKQAKNDDGSAAFDPDIEARELREVCESAAPKSTSLVAACTAVKR